MDMSDKAHRALNHLCCVYLGHRERQEESVAREMLLASPVFRRGSLVDVRADVVGAGVFEVYLVERDWRKAAAAALLVFLAVLLGGAAWAQEVPEYNRDEWGRWERTGESGPGGCRWDVRHAALREAGSASPNSLVISDEPGKACRVRALAFVDRYTGQRYSGAAGDFDVDEVVALSEAHRSGGWMWTPEQKSAFHNDPLNHVVTPDSVNQSKSDRDPGGENYRGGFRPWLPPDPAAHCWYATTWVAVKEKWGLTYDKLEARALVGVLASCEDVDEQARRFLVAWALQESGISAEDLYAWSLVLFELSEILERGRP